MAVSPFIVAGGYDWRRPSRAARKAMLLYPGIGEWEPSKELLEQLIVHY